MQDQIETGYTELIIPILTYHGLSRNSESNRYTLSENEFSKHLEFLQAYHFKTILVQELNQALTGSTDNFSPRDVVITFDDGHESDHSIALPLLNKFGFKATFFITTDWIGKNGYMNVLQLKELKEAGMSVQSHAKSHRLLDELSRADILLEMRDSKKMLEDVLGSEVSFLAFPGGRYNQDVVTCGKELNFKGLFSSVPYFLEKFNNTLLVGRYNVKRSALSEIYFRNFLEGNPMIRPFFKGSYHGKYYLKKILGNRLYHLLWKKYIGKS